jgi:hypothetical protein
MLGISCMDEKLLSSQELRFMELVTYLEIRHMTYSEMSPYKTTHMLDISHI